jgi:hypothetical protein
MPDHCGFQLSLSSLPAAWSGHSVWCSFDQDGLFRLPQEQAVAVPTLQHQEQMITSSVGYSERGHNAPADLQSHWQALEDFRLFLDGLEQELNRRDGIRAQQSKRQPSLAGFVGKLLRQGR